MSLSLHSNGNQCQGALAGDTLVLDCVLHDFYLLEGEICCAGQASDRDS